VAALPSGKGRSGRASDEVSAYSGKARDQAVESHQVGGDGELAVRLLASKTTPLSSMRSPASSAREKAPRPPISLVREDRAAPSRVARNSRLIDGRHRDQAAIALMPCRTDAIIAGTIH